MLLSRLGEVNNSTERDEWMTCDRRRRSSGKAKAHLQSLSLYVYISPLSTRGYLGYLFNLLLFFCSCQTRVKSTFQEVVGGSYSKYTLAWLSLQDDDDGDQEEVDLRQCC